MVPVILYARYSSVKYEPCCEWSCIYVTLIIIFHTSNIITVFDFDKLHVLSGENTNY